MRLIFTICAFICCVGLASAQTEQGTSYIGASSNISFSSMKTDFKSDNEDED